MIGLKVKAEKKTKFVQFFPDMVKQIDEVLRSKGSNINFEKANNMQLSMPEFNYSVI